MSSPEQVVEQFLLFDHTEYIKGINYIGTVAISELIIIGESDDVLELLEPQLRDPDLGSRLFEI